MLQSGYRVYLGPIQNILQQGMEQLIIGQFCPRMVAFVTHTNPK